MRSHASAHRGALLGLVCALAMTGTTPAVAEPVANERSRGGDELWLQRYNGGVNGPDQPAALVVSQDGTRVFVTGTSDGLPGSGIADDYVTVAYDAATGQRVWLSRYHGSSCTSAAAAVALSPDQGTVFVTGFTGCLGGEDFATVAYAAASGAELWVRTYDGPIGDPDEAYALAVSPDGGALFVTGRSFGRLGKGRDYLTVAYQTSTGDQLWVRRYVGPGPNEEEGDDEAYALAVSPDGATVFVTGASHGADSGWDYATLAYDAATGQRRWLSRYNGEANSDDLAQGLAVSPDGYTLFVTGYSYGASSLSDQATLAYDAATGQRQWLERYDGPSHGFDLAYSVAVSPDGASLFVTGDSDGMAGIGITDYLTAALDAATGTRVWQRRYDGPRRDRDTARALAMSPDGAKVFVTGWSYRAGGNFPFDYATLSYDAITGDQLWLRRFNGSTNGSDGATDIAVSPDGARVFVTGFSDREGEGSNPDYVTLAYAS